MMNNSSPITLWKNSPVAVIAQGRAEGGGTDVDHLVLRARNVWYAGVWRSATADLCLYAVFHRSRHIDHLDE